MSIDARADESVIPTLYDWAGGAERIDALMQGFYARVHADPVLAPVFAKAAADHPERVGQFISEVLGGPKRYSKTGGSHHHMIVRHLGRHLNDDQRKRWIALLLETADEMNLPADPEFRSALVGYLEWGTRIAVLNSQPGVAPPAADLPMPAWDWGPPGGPYRG
jgi:hemoglobin